MVTSSAGKLGKEIPILLTAIIFALTCPVKKVIIVFLPEFVLAVLVQQAQCLFSFVGKLLPHDDSFQVLDS